MPNNASRMRKIVNGQTVDNSGFLNQNLQNIKLFLRNSEIYFSQVRNFGHVSSHFPVGPVSIFIHFPLN